MLYVYKILTIYNVLFSALFSLIIVFKWLLSNKLIFIVIVNVIVMYDLENPNLPNSLIHKVNLLNKRMAISSIFTFMLNLNIFHVFLHACNTIIHISYVTSSTSICYKIQHQTCYRQTLYDGEDSVEVCVLLLHRLDYLSQHNNRYSSRQA